MIPWESREWRMENEREKDCLHKSLICGKGYMIDIL